ncbi:MAG: type III pantothenate kinase [Eubacterium sp.]|nr:type III pantothenate kinase [Eubacterium sp.]
MLLALDIGNTNITGAIFDGDEMMATFRMTTKVPRTSDEFGMMITNLIEKNKIKPHAITDIIVASVVPKINYSLGSALIKYFNITPITVEPGIKTGIRLDAYNPRQVGSDRIVDAVAAYTLYGGPVIVVDFGTATTYDLVTEEGSFTGGVTAPGAQSAASSLWNLTAQLPEVQIVKPTTVIAKDTVSSMQAGIYYSQIGQTEAIIRELKRESGKNDIKVVATGGLGGLITEGTDIIDIYDPALTMKGLKIIFDKQPRRQ